MKKIKRKKILMKNIFTKKNCLENKAWLNNNYICGIDEVGRGCLFGPLVVSAVVLPLNTNQTFLHDSKVMIRKDREKAYDWIKQNCFFTKIFVDVYTIEKINIYNATRFAMKKAFIQLLEIVPFEIEKIKYLITDAVKINLCKNFRHKNLEIFNPTKAESKSCSVAAASIFAKVTRDRFIEKISKDFPNFNLFKHKGYGTKIHTSAIKEFGLSIMHRKSFVSNSIKKSDIHGQQTIC